MLVHANSRVIVRVRGCCVSARSLSHQGEQAQTEKALPTWACIANLLSCVAVSFDTFGFGVGGGPTSELNKHKCMSCVIEMCNEMQNNAAAAASYWLLIFE